MESYSLLQLNEYIKRVIALNFREAVWIEAEIIQIKESRGNHYLELVQKDDNSDEVLAQASAAIWYRNYSFIKKKTGELLSDLLTAGTQVRIKCRVDFNERYGFKLLVEDIDPKFTFGQLELQKQEVYNQLVTEGLVELNKGLILSPVIQRIAVISSSNSAGYQDFTQQLFTNPYNYFFDIDTYNCAVQGQKVESDTLKAIKIITAKKKAYDAVLIIRGGGSRLDLSAYDNYEISKAIAQSEVPFLIGIGHDIDTSIVDLVSHSSLKTPTAVADFLIDHNLQFESNILDFSERIKKEASQMIRNSELRLNELKERLKHEYLVLFQDQMNHLQLSMLKLKTNTQRLLIDQAHQLQNALVQLEAADPKEVLRRGYSYIVHNSKHIRSVKLLNKKDQIIIHMEDGSTNAEII